MPSAKGADKPDQLPILHQSDVSPGRLLADVPMRSEIGSAAMVPIFDSGQKPRLPFIQEVRIRDIDVPDDVPNRVPIGVRARTLQAP